MKKILIGLLLGIIIICGGCSNTQPKLSQMQLREITTKEISGDYKTVFKSTMSVLQDHNYIIKNADLDTGLISCEKITEQEDTSEEILMVLFVDAGYDGKSSKVNISAIVTELTKNTTKIRLNIQETIITRGSFGNNEKATFVTNKEIYDSLFNQIKVETERLKALK